MNKWIKIFLILAAMGFIGAAAVYFFVYNKPHTNYEKAKPDFEMTAQALYNAFANSQSEAEQIYNGKIIQIEGSLDSVEEADSLVIAIIAFDQGMFGPEGIRCSMLENHSNTVKQINSGTIVQLKGFCSGFSGTDVILESCSVID